MAQETAERMGDIHLCDVMRQGHTCTGAGCNKYLLVQSWMYCLQTPFDSFCGFSVRINCHEKVRVTLICIRSGSIDTARLWATV